MRSLLVLEDELGLARCPRPRARGYAFAELAVAAGARAAEAERLLSALGFRHVGPHRSKPVQLWDHGDARVVVNHGDAHDEPRIAALAVESADARPLGRARRGAARAASCRAAARPARPTSPRSPRPTAPRCSSAAPTATGCRDFLAPAAPGAGGAELTAIDHVALSQPFDSFDEAALFYRSVLGARARGRPGARRARRARAQPRALSADGSVRLALNVPRARRAGSDRAPARRVRAATTCSPPPRRCASAACRCSRSPATTTTTSPRGSTSTPGRSRELRELGVLYDRDARGGSSCTSTPRRSGASLFFEVLERRGGYDGYGAANSPVRMAAQRRAASPQLHRA